MFRATQKRLPQHPSAGGGSLRAEHELKRLNGMLGAAWLVVATTVVTTLLTEGLAWLFIYRTSSYQRLREHFDRAGSKLDALKAKGSASKKEKRLEVSAKTRQHELMSVKFWTTAITLAFLLLGYNLVIKQLFGLNVATLPFSPPSYFKGMFQRGLTNPGAYDCGVVGIYALASMSVRPVISKLLGLGPTRAMEKYQPTLDDIPALAKAKAS